MRAQNVSGLELPKPPQQKKKTQGCTGCTAPKSNLRACRRQTKLFVAPKRDEIQKKKRKWEEEREKIKQAKLNLAETKSVKAAKENDARKKRTKPSRNPNERRHEKKTDGEKVLLNLALCGP